MKNASSLAVCAFRFGNAVDIDGFKFKGSRSISDLAQRSIEKIMSFLLETNMLLTFLFKPAIPGQA